MLHKYFIQKFPWYQRWHDRPNCNFLHWVFLCGVVAVTGGFIYRGMGVTLNLPLSLNNLSLALNVGPVSEVSITENANNWLVTLPGGSPISTVFLNGFVYVALQASDQLVKVNPANPDNYETLTFVQDGKHDGPYSLTYAPSTRLLYVFFRAPTKVNISSVDPNTLAVIDVVVDEPDLIPGEGAIVTDNTYLYVLAQVSSKVRRYLLTNFANQSTLDLPFASGHAMAYDGGKIYVAANSSPIQFTRIGTSPFTVEDSSSSAENSYAADDMAVTTGYFWTGASEDMSGKVYRINKSNLSDFTVINTGISGPNFGVFFDGTYIWAIYGTNPGQAARINPEDLSVTQFLFPDGQRSPNEMSFNGSLAYITYYQTPGKLSENILSTTTTPTAPSNLTSTVISSNQINLSWIDNSTNETNFHVERCQNSGCTDFIQISLTTADVTAHIDLGLTPSTLYRYRVKASNSSGDSAYSDITEATTLAEVDTTSPTVSITSPAGNATVSGIVSINANASDNVGVIKVEFYIDDVLKSTDNISPYAYNWDTTTYTNALHTIKAKAFDATNNTAESSISVIVSNDTIPAAPKNLKTTSIGKTTATISWTDNSSNETNFVLERCTGSGCTNFAVIATLGANVTTYSNSGLKRKTTYRYRVKASNVLGSSAYSNILAVTTK